MAPLRAAAFLLATTWTASAAPLRLAVNGSSLLDPSNGGTPIRLTGFNWVLTHLHEGDGAYMRSLMPDANVARIVGVLWDDSRCAPEVQRNMSVARETVTRRSLSVALKHHSES